MRKYIQEVAIGNRGSGWVTCIICGSWMFPGFPENYPQVCHECADKHVLHYCNRKRPAEAQEGK